jgi:chromosome partitioning protein
MIIAIANQKGGVGKTTTAVTIADGLARLGKSVLLVDLDPQGNVADSLGIDPGGDLQRAISNNLSLQSVAVKVNECLSVVRSDKTTVILKSNLAGMDFREYVLDNSLAECRADYVILDCAPSMDVLHTAALVAADYLVVPTRLDQFSVKGVVEVLRTLSSIRRFSNSACEIGGIVPTFYDRQTTETQEQLENLVSVFGELVYPVVPVDTVCRKAHRAGKTLFEFAPKCRALIGYPELPCGYTSVINRILKL